jgi:cyclin-dependent kinase 8/11
MTLTSSFPAPGAASGSAAMPPSRHMLARAHVPSDSGASSAMQAYKSYRDSVRQPFLQRYAILGFLSSGTYGKVYKARVRRPDSTLAGEGQDANDGGARPHNEDAREDMLTRVTREEETGEEMYAIKKFKPDKETDTLTYTGISQSAMREIAVSLRRHLSRGQQCLTFAL